MRTTYSLREFFTIFPMVTCSTDGVLSTCVVRAWSVRGPCLLRTSQVQLSNEQTELTWTVPSKHVLRTYNALISAVEQVTVGKVVPINCTIIVDMQHTFHFDLDLILMQLGLLENLGRSSIYTPTPISGGQTHIHRTCTHLQRASEYGHRA